MLPGVDLHALERSLLDSLSSIRTLQQKQQQVELQVQEAEKWRQKYEQEQHARKATEESLLALQQEHWKLKEAMQLHIAGERRNFNSLRSNTSCHARMRTMKLGFGPSRHARGGLLPLSISRTTSSHHLHDQDVLDATADGTSDATPNTGMFERTATWTGQESLQDVLQNVSQHGEFVNRSQTMSVNGLISMLMTANLLGLQGTPSSQPSATDFNKDMNRGMVHDEILTSLTNINTGPPSQIAQGQPDNGQSKPLLAHAGRGSTEAEAVLGSSPASARSSTAVHRDSVFAQYTSNVDAQQQVARGATHSPAKQLGYSSQSQLSHDDIALSSISLVDDDGTSGVGLAAAAAVAAAAARAWANAASQQQKRHSKSHQRMSMTDDTIQQHMYGTSPDGTASSAHLLGNALQQQQEGGIVDARRSASQQSSYTNGNAQPGSATSSARGPTPQGSGRRPGRAGYKLVASVYREPSSLALNKSPSQLLRHNHTASEANLSTAKSQPVLHQNLDSAASAASLTSMPPPKAGHHHTSQHPQPVSAPPSVASMAHGSDEDIPSPGAVHVHSIPISTRKAEGNHGVINEGGSSSQSQGVLSMISPLQSGHIDTSAPQVGRPQSNEHHQQHAPAQAAETPGALPGHASHGVTTLQIPDPGWQAPGSCRPPASVPARFAASECGTRLKRLSLDTLRPYQSQHVQGSPDRHAHRRSSLDFKQPGLSISQNHNHGAFGSPTSTATFLLQEPQITPGSHLASRNAVQAAVGHAVPAVLGGSSALPRKLTHVIMGAPHGPPAGSGPGSPYGSPSAAKSCIGVFADLDPDRDHDNAQEAAWKLQPPGSSTAHMLDGSLLDRSTLTATAPDTSVGHNDLGRSVTPVTPEKQRSNLTQALNVLSSQHDAQHVQGRATPSPSMRSAFQVSQPEVAAASTGAARRPSVENNAITYAQPLQWPANVDSSKQASAAYFHESPGATKAASTSTAAATQKEQSDVDVASTKSGGATAGQATLLIDQPLKTPSLSDTGDDKPNEITAMTAAVVDACSTCGEASKSTALKLHWLSPPRTVLVVCKLAANVYPLFNTVLEWLRERHMEVYIEPSALEHVQPHLRSQPYAAFYQQQLQQHDHDSPNPLSPSMPSPSAHANGAVSQPQHEIATRSLVPPGQSQTEGLSESQSQQGAWSVWTWPEGRCPNSSIPDEVAQDLDFVVVLGGDGTLLWTCHVFGNRAVPPLLPFNMGSLGFLTPFPPSFLDSMLGLALKGGFPMILRHRLHATIVRVPREGKAAGGDVCWADGHCASEKVVLNEVVVDRGISPFLTNLECFCDGNFVTHVQGDGLIISTPTGSTAYSLAAGGSMVHPQVPGILFTPVCPHSLSFRPLVFPDHVQLCIQVPHGARSQMYCSFDGKDRQELNAGDAIIIRMSQWPIPTVCSPDPSRDWFTGIREGLHWNERRMQAGAGH